MQDSLKSALQRVKKHHRSDLVREGTGNKENKHSVWRYDSSSKGKHVHLPAENVEHLDNPLGMGYVATFQDRLRTCDDAQYAETESEASQDLISSHMRH